MSEPNKTTPAPTAPASNAEQKAAPEKGPTEIGKMLKALAGGRVAVGKLKVTGVKGSIVSFDNKTTMNYLVFRDKCRAELTAQGVI